MANRLTEENLKDPVTKFINRDFYSLYPEQTIGEALAMMRAFPPTGRIIYFYVVDKDSRLQGVVPTRRLLLSPLDKKISEVMIQRVITIPSAATLLDAVEFFSLHKLLAFPVLDEAKRLIGIIDIELYAEELAEIEGAGLADEVFQIAGMTLTRARQANPLQAFRGRFPWLLCNVAGGLIAAFLSGIYQDVLNWQNAVLALFIPVVLALAESVSIQSVSLAVDGLRTGRATWKTLLLKLRSEVATGLLLGLGTGLLVALVALFWQGLLGVVLCLICGIVGGVTCAALIGVSVPTVLKLLKLDPGVASGPIALAGADVVTLLIYFNIGMIVMR